VAYALFSLGYGLQLLRHRQYALRLQIAVLAVIAAGVLETATWLGVYVSKNASGIPTPCSDVCPTTPDYLFAVLLSVLKRSVSRAGLLAVALGYGVVHPVLERRQTYMIAGLAVAYFVFGVLDAVSRRTAYDVDTNTWELPVVLVDFVFITMIYSGLMKLRRDLAEGGQQVGGGSP
jgi:hypothetical protein